MENKQTHTHTQTKQPASQRFKTQNASGEHHVFCLSPEAATRLLLGQI
jgi:hypothetical protein